MEIRCTKSLKYKIGDLVKVDKEKLRPNDLTLVKIEYLVEFDDGVRLWVKDDLVK